MPTAASRVLVALAWSCAGALELYERLGATQSATAKQIRQLYHARALATHPDKAPAGEQESAAQLFKEVSEAYEVLSNKALRVQYDRTGRVPTERERAATNTQHGSDAAEEYGFEGSNARAHPGAQHGWRNYGGWERTWQNGRWEQYDTFSVNLAQQRAKRLRSVTELRSALSAGSGATPSRYGLIGFYRAGHPPPRFSH